MLATTGSVVTNAVATLIALTAMTEGLPIVMQRILGIPKRQAINHQTLNLQTLNR